MDKMRMESVDMTAQNIEKMYVSGVFGGLPEYKEVENEAQ